MGAIDDIHEDIYWQGIEQGMVIAVRLIKARERADHAAAHCRWEKHWRTRVAKALRQWADNLELPEPTGGE